MATIDLEKHRSVIGNTKSRVFAGRPRGEAVRKASRINDLFSPTGMLTVKVPDDIFSITPSFLEELLADIASVHSRQILTGHIEFKGEYQIGSSLEEALDRLYATKTGLEI